MRNKLGGFANIRYAENDKHESFAGLGLTSLRITRTGHPYGNSTREKLFNQPYENTANRQPLLRHPCVDFFRPTAAATGRLAGGGISPHESRCRGDFAHSWGDAHRRHLSGHDNRDRFSDVQRKSHPRPDATERVG